MNKKDQQYAKTLKAIQDATDFIVSSDGFKNLTVREVCKKAGVTHGAFYHYFSSKDDLLMDRVNRLSLHMDDYYEKKLKSLHTREALKSFIDEYIRFVMSKEVNIFVEVEKTLYSQAHKENEILWGSKRILKYLIHKAVEKGEICSLLSEDEIFEFLQTMCSGISKRYCITHGRSLPNHSLQSEINKWIDSLYC